MLQELQTKKYTFSGHETFHCRGLWLKKGYDYLLLNKRFSDEDAVVNLGVGKNMVASIRYWMKACDLIGNDDQPTPLAHLIFDDQEGFDPYLEDEGTLWLLHYHLVVKDYASIYNLIFNTFRRYKIAFQKEDFIKYVIKLASSTPNLNVGVNTAENDFNVMAKMYLRLNDDKDETLSGLFTDLNLINFRKDGQYYIMPNLERDSLPADILLYAILDGNRGSNSISYQRLENDKNQVGNTFALSQDGLVNKIEELTDKFDKLVFSDQDGVMELQLKADLDPYNVLSNYYAGI
ncbi:DUF4007 family protein [Dyadobacter sp. 32]|uniref:DUF4007 family protein n=1 Tax=Dyadobacter sp. 32 TaxID=538966 RepID=UPI0011EE49A1